MPPGWTFINGEHWYQRPGGGSRGRGVVHICQTCGDLFPALKRNPGRFCSKTCTGRAIGGSNRQTRPDLFEHWTPEECWLAGLIWSDGALNQRPRGDRILLRMTDEQAIAAAAAIAGCSYHTDRNREPPRKPLHGLQIGERNAVARLLAAGLDRPKTAWPHLPHPAAFLRGVFDGDGCVSLSTRKSYPKNGRRYVPCSLEVQSLICGSQPFLEGMQAFLAAHRIPPKIIRPQGAIHVVRWGKHDSLRLADIMYADAGPCLSRKRDIFAQALAAYRANSRQWYSGAMANKRHALD